MATTKYIVDNLSAQTITGNLTVVGEISNSTGINNSIQYNNNGVLSGNSGFTYGISSSQLVGLTYVNDVTTFGNISEFKKGTSVWEQNGYVFVLTYFDNASSYILSPGYIDVYDAITLNSIVSGYNLRSDVPSPLTNQYSGAWQIHGDGNYIYISVAGYTSYNGPIMTYSFDGSSLTFIGLDDEYSMSKYSQMWSDGTYLYAAPTTSATTSDSKLTAYKVTDGVFKEVARYDGVDTLYDHSSVFCQNGFIYVGNYDWDSTGDAVIQAYTFDGTAFTKVHQSVLMPIDGNVPNVSSINGDGTYLYISDSDYNNLIAVVHDPISGFTELNYIEATEMSTLASIYSDDGLIYLSQAYNTGNQDLFKAYTFNGTNFNVKFYLPPLQGSSSCVSSVVSDSDSYYLLWKDTLSDINVLYKYSKDIIPPTPTVSLDGDIEITGNINTGVKKYVALLSQSGTDAPIPTVLENTLGGAPVWTYIGTGQYHCTLTGAFPKEKTFCLVTYGYDWGNRVVVYFGHSIGSDYLYMYAYDLVTGTATDIQNGPSGNDLYVEIRVYP